MPSASTANRSYQVTTRYYDHGGTIRGKHHGSTAAHVASWMPLYALNVVLVLEQCHSDW